MTGTLHIYAKDIYTLHAVKLVERITGSGVSLVEEDDVNKAQYLDVGGKQIQGYIAIFSHIAGDNSPLLGTNENEKKEVITWLNNYFTELLPLLLVNDKKLNVALHKQNKSLLSSVFLVSNHFTLADLVFYAAIHPLLAQWNEKERVIFLNITRWFDNIQHLPEVTSLAGGPLLPLIHINTEVPVEQPKEKPKVENAQIEKPNTNPKGKGKVANTETAEKPTPAPPAEKEQNTNNKEKQQPKDNKEQKPKNEQPAGKGKGGGAANEVPELSETEDVSRFDIRVARIVSCKKHEGADSLYVELIDVGEPEPRQVVSGLVKFVPLEEMQNRRIVILCNLKASNLKGVRSQAMVLCASNDDHTKVELVEPPEGAAIGERVTFPDFVGEPEKVLKKETMDKVFPDLKTNGDLVATFRGVPFTTSAGLCVVRSIVNGGIK